MYNNTCTKQIRNGMTLLPNDLPLSPMYYSAHPNHPNKSSHLPPSRFHYPQSNAMLLSRLTDWLTDWLSGVASN